MSAKGNCYDDACAESFFHTQKVECTVCQPENNANDGI
jgi:transposase InsO family protein